MSSEEFAEWSVMFKAEELHPSAERLRHAQILAALHNGPLTRKSHKLWATREFFNDFWKMAASPVDRAPTPIQLAAQIASINGMRRGRHGR